MTYINFITGLIIAAVLSVPGAMQHEATQVGEELAVEYVQTTGTFLFLGGTDWTDPDAYQYAPLGVTCHQGRELCAIEAPIANPSAPDNLKEPVISGSLHSELQNLQDADPQDRNPSETVMLKD